MSHYLFTYIEVFKPTLFRRGRFEYHHDLTTDDRHPVLTLAIMRAQGRNCMLVNFWKLPREFYDEIKETMNEPATD